MARWSSCGSYCSSGAMRWSLPATAGNAALPAIGSRRPSPVRADRPRPGLSAVVGLMILCVVVAGLSLLWPHSLTYDPWSWALWGREIVHGSLTPAGGSSWKPLPVIFDSLFSLFGAAAPDLWLVLARAGALMALVFSFRLAARAAGPLAGITAVAWVIFSTHFGFVFGWLKFFGSGWSEGLLVALVLGAIESHAENRRRVALAAWFAAALIRPEAAVFLLLYAALAVRREHGLWIVAAVLLLAVPVLWLVPDYLGSGQLLLGSSQALNDVPSSLRHAQHPGLRDVSLLRDLLSAPALVGVALAVVLARAQVRRLVLGLLGVAIGWLVIVAVMAEAGYPGIPRFLIVSVSLICVVAGIGWGCAANWATRRPVRLLTAAAVVAINAFFLLGHLPELREQSAETSYEAKLNAQLSVVLRRAGGSVAVRRCGLVTTSLLEVPVLAWDLGYGASVTDREVGTGMIFRTRIFGQQLPAPPPAQSGFMLITHVGTWWVYARCQHPRGPAA